MDNFKFHASTEILFGKDEIKNLGEVLKRYGNKILLGYGGGSIKKTGLYDTLIQIFKDNGIEHVELSGIEPNPQISSVERGVKLCREHKVDAILAVGGGSTIDCCKVVGAAYYYEGDPWDLVLDSSVIDKVLPIITILTLAGTGSEMNKNAVISKSETNEKRGASHWNMVPKVSILDPQYLYTLPAIQTASGTADIMSHVFEAYFKTTIGAFVQDRFSEGVLKTCIKYLPIALKEPENYEARANLMWASTMALNGTCGSGKGGSWSCHPIEHELSAYYDIAHGLGLVILTPRWFRFVLSEKTVDKFYEYGVNVWCLAQDQDKFAVAKKAIDLTENFFRENGLPTTLREVGISDDSKLEIMAKSAVEKNGLQSAFVPLSEADVLEILRNSL